MPNETSNEVPGFVGQIDPNVMSDEGIAALVIVQLSPEPVMGATARGVVFIAEF